MIPNPHSSFLNKKYSQSLHNWAQTIAEKCKDIGWNATIEYRIGFRISAYCTRMHRCSSETFTGSLLLNVLRDVLVIRSKLRMQTIFIWYESLLMFPRNPSDEIFVNILRISTSEFNTVIFVGLIRILSVLYIVYYVTFVLRTLCGLCSSLVRILCNCTFS